MHAAGIDVGAKEHLVAVPCDRDPQPVRTFQAFTPDLHELATWLKRCGIETVALESTGIYWISLYEVLEQCGFENSGGQCTPCKARAGPNWGRFKVIELRTSLAVLGLCYVRLGKSLILWRKGWDSNPRYGYPYA